jgi:hypothetical protein
VPEDEDPSDEVPCPDVVEPKSDPEDVSRSSE